MYLSGLSDPPERRKRSDKSSLSRKRAIGIMMTSMKRRRVRGGSTCLGLRRELPTQTYSTSPKRGRGMASSTSATSVSEASTQETVSSSTRLGTRLQVLTRPGRASAAMQSSSITETWLSTRKRLTPTSPWSVLTARRLSSFANL